MNYRIISHLSLPVPRPRRRLALDDLVELAKIMNVGDAAVLSNSDAQVLRYVLVAMGFDCITDGYRCDEVGKTLAFKIAVPPREVPDLGWYDI